MLTRKKYKSLNNQLRGVVRPTDNAKDDNAKDNWWRKQCEELEQLDRKGSKYLN